jgi:uncharacterized small protein (DUF1192 family)
MDLKKEIERTVGALLLSNMELQAALAQANQQIGQLQAENEALKAQTEAKADDKP